MSNIVKQQTAALALPVSEKQFLELYIPNQCTRKFSGLCTALEAYKTESFSLAKIKKAYSEDWTLAYISLWIVNINEFLNVSRPMSEPQIEETSFLILSQYYYLKLSDITLIFTKAKRGDWGPLYESLDGMKILSWFEKYANERSDAVYADTTKEHYKTKQPDAKRTSDTSDIKTEMKRARGFLLIEQSKKTQ